MAVRAKTLDRRSEILKAARAIFAQKGLEASKISDIVAEAGVAQGTFYLYFPSKSSVVEALASEAYGSILNAIMAACNSKQSTAEQLEAMVRAAFAVGESYDDVTTILHSGVALVENPRDWQRYFEPFKQFLAEFIRRGIASGELEPTLKPEHTARLILLTVNAAIDECYSYYPNQDSQPFIDSTIGFVQRAVLKKQG